MKTSKAAHHLQATGDVGDELLPGGELEVADPAVGDLLALPDLGVDAVVDHLELGLVGDRHQLVLVVGRVVAGGAVLEVQEDHRVAGGAAEAIDLRGGQLGTEVEVGVARAVEVLEVVDHLRLGIEFPQEQGRAPAGVTDDQVRLDRGGDRLQSLIDPGRVPDPVLEGAGEVVGLLGRGPAGPVLDVGDAPRGPRRLLRDEARGPAALGDPASADVAELGREVLVGEEDVHTVGQVKADRIWSR